MIEFAKYQTEPHSYVYICSIRTKFNVTKTLETHPDINIALKDMFKGPSTISCWS